MSTGLPTVVIIGRPNVGKSTLFNRIAGRRIAVIDDRPGITRDRLYAESEHKGRRFELVDTGGILFGEDDPLVEQVRIQADVAINEADVIFFMVDAEEGIASGDWDLANHLRGNEKPIYLVANKVDNPDREPLIHEFHSLGIGEVVGVSAIHGSGVDSLLDSAVAGFPKDKGEMPDDTILVHLHAQPDVILQRMDASPHPHQLVPSGDVTPVLEAFAMEVRQSWIRRKIAIDTCVLCCDSVQLQTLS